MARKQRQNNPKDWIPLRGCCEVMLKNALNGEVILHGKGDNVVLYSGRSWAMQKCNATATLAGTITNNIVVGTGAGATQYTHTGPQGYYTYRSGTTSLSTQSAGAAVPVQDIRVSWGTADLTDTQCNSIREFLINNSTGSAGTYLCRYLSDVVINATTSNELLVTYTVSW